jgi:MATE family multidrug resistance protein
VASATLVAEWSGLGFGLWLCRAALAGEQWRDWARVLDPVRLKRMAEVNGDILVRSVVLQASFTSFLFLGAGLGDVTLAANQILLQFLEITAYALDGFAFAAEALVGHAFGRRDRGGLRRSAILASEWGVGGAIILAVAFLAAGPAVVDLMTTAPEVRAEARRFLPWIAAAPVVGIAAWMLDGVFIGATETRALRNAMLLSVTIYAAAVALLLPAYGNGGLWASLMILNTVRGVTLALRYPALEARASAS